MAKKDNTEVMTVSPKLQADLDILQAFKSQVDIVGLNLQQIIVTDETSLAVCQQNLSKANNLLNSIEEKRVLIKDPYFQSGKLIDSTAKTLSEELVAGIKKAKDQVAAWEKARIAEAKAKQDEIDRQLAEKAATDKLEQERKDNIRAYIRNKATPLLQKMYADCITVEICSQKLQSIEKNYKPKDFFEEYVGEAYELRDNYINLIKAKKEQLEKTSTMSDAEIEFSFKQEKLAIDKANLEMAQRELDAEKERINNEKKAKDAELEAEKEKQCVVAEAELNKTKGIRSNWKIELVDATKLPKEWIQMNDSVVKEYLKENKESLKDGQIINGVKFYKEISVSA